MAITDIRLTAPEVGYLWSGYMVDHMSVCLLTYMGEKSGNPQVKQVLTTARQIGLSQLDKRKVLLRGEGVPIPQGFSMEEDIHLDAPVLFSDRFCLYYLLNATRLGLVFFANSLAVATREDLRSFIMDSLQEAGRLYDAVISIMLEKGEYVRPPVLTPPTQPEFIQKTSFLDGIFGAKRPLMSMEISGLYANMELIHLVDAISTAFSQVARDAKVKELLVKTKKLADSHGNALLSLLQTDELHGPVSYLSDVGDSRVSPFSDRLMLCHIAGLNATVIEAYGYAVGYSMRNDLASLYLRQIGEAGMLAEEITQTLIDYEWLEKTPGALGARVFS